MRLSLPTALLVVAAAPVAASAQNLANDDNGAKATGRAGAVTATVADGSAVAYNPAGVAASSGTLVQVGASVQLTNTGFVPQGQAERVPGLASPMVTPHVFAIIKPHDVVAFGFGIYSPFASSAQWPTGTSLAEYARDERLRTVSLSPVVALDMHRWLPGLRLGGGLDVVPADFEHKRDLAFGDQAGQLHVGAVGVGLGWRVGAMYAPAKFSYVSAGVAYKHNVEIDFDGDVDFDAPVEFRNQLPLDGPAAMTLTLPSQLTGGIAVRPRAGLEFEANLVWTTWSWIDRPTIDVPGSQVVLSRRFADTLGVRAGVEYRLRGQDAAIRAGYSLDPSAVSDDELTPSTAYNDRHSATVGVTLRDEGLTLDIGARLVMPYQRTTSPIAGAPPVKGTYDTSSATLAATVSKRF